ncbi:hypothetical protein DL93DRAFT_2167267 [Clavulina sp. PMI_390]|nr:hypothetical protein DL93DRAFT_2167267 [Clavulina sp. PMI_390]
MTQTQTEPYSPVEAVDTVSESAPATSVIKKKKKRSKKKASQPDESVSENHADVAAAAAQINSISISKGKPKKSLGASPGNPPPLKLARNKHWKYVSSFHGQWLTLPIEMLESLYTSNTSPMPGIPIDADLAASSAPSQFSSSPNGTARRRRTQLDPRRSRMAGGLHSRSATYTDATSSTDQITLTVPPPIDPGVFRSLKDVRRLVDEAADLVLRAASGLTDPTSPSLDKTYSNYSYGNNSGYGYGGYQQQPHNTNPGGRKSTLSTIRANRMRALAVQKLAEAYKTDEIATCVLIMKGTTAFEDLAERVLRQDPSNLDAQYVQFFHQKVPSSPRQLCDTTTEALDALITARPDHLEYYRTRGVVHCFLEQYDLAIRDFTFGLRQALAARKKKRQEQHDDEHEDEGEDSHNTNALDVDESRTGAHGRRRRRKDEDNGLEESFLSGGSKENPALLHHSLGPSAPDPLETQLLFNRAGANLNYAIHLIERTVLSLEGVPFPTSDSPEVRLSALVTPPHLTPFYGPYAQSVKPRFGGVDLTNILGPRSGLKWAAYRRALNDDPQLQENVKCLLRDSIKDYKKFLKHFDTIVVPESAAPPPNMGAIGPPYSSSGSGALDVRSPLPSSSLTPRTTSTNGKGKAIAADPSKGIYPYNSLSSISYTASMGTYSTHDPQGVTGAETSTSLRAQSSASTGRAPPFADGASNEVVPTSFAIPLGDPTKFAGSADPAALYEALQGQIGNSSLASLIPQSVLDQLPALAAKAIDATLQQYNALQPSPSDALPGAAGSSTGSWAPEPLKWKDVPQAKQVAFAQFVTDCLRTSTSAVATSSTTTTHTNAAGMSTTTTTTLPLSPAPELERCFPVALTTYHPLIIEAHFSILLAHLMLGEPDGVLDNYVKAAISLDGADGYPIFSPARSMAQSDFNEILERLCAAWKYGKVAQNSTTQVGLNVAFQAQASSSSRNSASGSGASGSGSGSSTSRPDVKGKRPVLSSRGSEEHADTETSGLEAIRTLLAPIYTKLAHQRRAGSSRPAGMPLMLYCSPRVDVALAWLAAVHLPSWEDQETGGRSSHHS